MFSFNLVLAVAVLSGIGNTAIGNTSSGDTALYDFYTETCPPCRMMAPTVEQLSQAGYPVKKIDGNRHMDLVRQLRVDAYPTFIMVVDGRETGRIVGATDYHSLRNLCESGLRQRKARPAAPREPARLPETGMERPVAELLPPLFGAGGVVPAGANIPAAFPTPTAPVVRSATEVIGFATVRIRVAVGEGYRCGSGTIVDSRAGEALIITSSRLFAPQETPGRVDVDLFVVGRGPERIEGRLLRRDDARGLALIGIRVDHPVIAAAVAPRGVEMQSAMQVIAAGCDNGMAPRVQTTRIAAVGPYPATPTSVRVAGRAVVGRAGGGLFDLKGRLIGVCNTNVENREETYYIALGTLHDRLDESNLSFVYNDPRNDAPRTVEPSVTQWASNESRAGADTVAPTDTHQATRAADLTEIAGTMPLTADERAALAHLIKLMRGDTEIVCIVRSKKDPGAQSQILVLDRASPEFLSRLMAESLAICRQRSGDSALRGQNEVSDPTQPKR